MSRERFLRLLDAAEYLAAHIQAALEQYAVARELLRTKSATRWQVFGSLGVRN